MRALRSVMCQSFDDLEIIVVDDGSTDDTTAIVEAAQVPNLTLIRHPQNQGAAAARNTGIRASRGRYVAFLDSDDVWAPEKLSRQLSKLEHTQADIMACTSGYWLHRHGTKVSIPNDLSPGQFRQQILFGCSISPGATLVVDRRVFDKIGFFDVTLRRLEDWDWLLRFAEHYDMTSVTEPLADVYLEPTSRPELVLDALRRIRTTHLRRLSSWTARRQLLSSVLVEHAAVMNRSGKPLHAVLIILASLLLYPFRNAAFYRTISRSLLRKSRYLHVRTV